MELIASHTITPPPPCGSASSTQFWATTRWLCSRSPPPPVMTLKVEVLLITEPGVPPVIFDSPLMTTVWPTGLGSGDGAEWGGVPCKVFEFLIQQNAASCVWFGQICGVLQAMPGPFRMLTGSNSSSGRGIWSGRVQESLTLVSPNAACQLLNQPFWI